MDFYCSGIYRILCVPTFKFYIGSSRDIYTRWSKHKSDLRKNKHANQHMQNAWNKYGGKNFSIVILEIVEESKLLLREQDWIDKESPAFNIILNIDQNCGEISSKSYILTSPNGKEYHIDNMAKFCREKKISANGLYQVARGETNLARGWHARFKGESMSDWNNKKKRGHKPGGGHDGFWLITHPDGAEEKVLSLTAFCKLRGLSQGNLSETASGRRSQHKGYRADRI